MKKLSFICAVLSLTTLTACQSTQQTQQSYDAQQFSNQTTVGFKPLTQKRSFTHDAQLAYVMVNRAIPSDQVMVLAIEQQRQQHFIYAQSEHLVKIKGPNTGTQINHKQSYAWRDNDKNAKAIYGPK